MMKDEWRLKDDDFKLLRGFDNRQTDKQTNRQTDKQTFVNVESLLQLKTPELTSNAHIVCLKY